ncbi:MAG: DUF2059 domain-containing protein [Acinetobacter bohemicus]
MKKFNQLLCSIALCSLSFTTFAQPATETSVEKALKLSDISGTLAQSQQDMRPIYDQQAEEVIRNIFKIQQLNAEQQKAAKQIADVTASFSQKLISDPKFVQMLKKVYMQTFTEEEVLANIQFLETPIGQSINKKSSKMMAEIMRNSIEMSNAMMQDPTTQKEMNQRVEKILKPLFKQNEQSK